MASRRTQDHQKSDGPSQPFGTIYLPESAPAERDPKRLKLLKITAPIALIIGITGLWFIGLYLWTTLARSDWNSQDYGGATSSYEQQIRVTAAFPEPWLAQYNLGTALLAEGDLDGGVDRLQQAFQGVPKAVQGESGSIQPFSYECSVRMNLSAGIEMKGDAAAAEGADNAALKLYETALEWLTPCEVPPSGGGGDSADQSGDQGGGEGEDSSNSEQAQQSGEAGDRLREKLNQGEEEPSESSDNPSGEQTDQGESDQQSQTDPFEGESEEQRQQREELQNKNQQQAEREREKSEQQNRGGGGGW